MNTPILIHLAEFLAKSVLLLAPTLMLAAAMRRCSAARRHTVLVAAFVALLLLPLGRFAAPHWHLPGVATTAALPIRIATMDAIPLVAAPAEPAAAVARPVKFSWPEPSRLLIGLWLAGGVALLGFRAFGSWQITRLKRSRTMPADARLSALGEAVAGEQGCRVRYEVRFSAAVRVPCTWGVWRATVLLPVEARQWSEAHVIAALRHEFAHIARRDYLTRWLSTIACALYWPNPLVWLAARQLRIAQEQACDDLVLRAGTPSADYATLLFEAARACAGAAPGWRNAIPMANPATLENRVVAVMDETRDRRPAGRLAKLLGGFGMTAMVGVSALAQVADVQPPTPADVADPSPQQVMISAKFIEVPQGVFSADQIYDNVLALNKTATILSAPRMVVNAGQRGTVQIGEERPLPPGSEPKMQFVGTTLDVLPTIANAKIHVQCTAEMISPSGEDPATKRPLFNHRKVTSTLTFASGGKAVLPAFASEKAGHEIFVVLEASIVAASPNAARAATPPTVESVLLEKARKIVIPEVKFQETPMVEAVAYLQQRSIELDPEGKGVKMIFRPGAIGANLSTNFKDIPLSAALQFVGSGPYELVAEEDSLVIQPRVDSGPTSKISSEVAGGPGEGIPAEKPTAAPAPDHAIDGADSDNVVMITQDKVESDGSISKNIGKARRAIYDSNTGNLVLTGKPSVQQGISLCVALNDSTVMTLKSDGRLKVNGPSRIVIANSPPAESPLLEKAKKIVIPKFELRKNTVAEAAPMLQALSAEFDPEKKGVKIVAGPDTFNGTLTATLKDIPLSDALKYIASLSNSELQATGDAFVLWPLGPGGNPPPDAKPAKAGVAPSVALLHIDVNADETHTEDGMLVADGNARMKYGSTMVTADRLRYDQTTQRMEFHGKVEIKYEKGTMRGEHVTVRFGPDGRILFGELDGEEAAPKSSSPDAK